MAFYIFSSPPRGVRERNFRARVSLTAQRGSKPTRDRQAGNQHHHESEEDYFAAASSRFNNRAPRATHALSTLPVRHKASSRDNVYKEMRVEARPIVQTERGGMFAASKYPKRVSP